MKFSDYQEVEQMINKLICFIRWKGAHIESKQKKIVKELSLIKQFCYGCTIGN